MRSKNLWFLITPSGISAIFSGFLSFLIVTSVSVVYAQRSGSLYRILFNQAPPLDVINSSAASFSSLFNILFANHDINVILTILFWSFIGFLAYMVVFLGRNSTSNTIEFIRQFNYIHADPKQIGKRVIVRLALFTAAYILLAFYLLFFSIVLLPLCFYRIQSTIIGNAGRLQLGYAFLLIFISAHIFVLLLRFSLLRSRIFRSN